MSGWDAPTGSWDPGEEPEGARSDDQGYQHARPTGYDQAQDYDQTAGYGQGTVPYGPGPGAQHASYEPAAQPSQEPSAFRRRAGSNPLSAGGYDWGGSGAYSAYGSQEASATAWSGADDQDYGSQAFRPQQPADAGYGSLPGRGEDYPTQVLGRPGYDQPGYAPQDYGQGASGYQTEVYPRQGFESPDYDQRGYADQGNGLSGYDQNGYGQETYGQHAYRQETYGQDAYRQDSYGQGGYSPDAYRQEAHGQHAYRQDGYGHEAYAQPGSDRPAGPAYGDDGPGVPAPQTRPGRSGSSQRPPQRLSGFRMILYLLAAVVGVVLIVWLVIHLTQSGSTTPAASSTTTTGGSNTTAGSSNTTAGSTASPTTAGSTASPTTGPGAAAGAGTPFVLTKAASVGSYPLNSVATNYYVSIANPQVTPYAQAIKAKGAGVPGKEVVAMYNLSSVTSVWADNYTAIGFVGFNGTFKPDAVIAYMKTQLTSTRMASAGPHGGQMMCGYYLSASSGKQASECLWVTPTTFGMAQFIVDRTQSKYSDTSALTIELRNAVEVKAS